MMDSQFQSSGLSDARQKSLDIQTYLLTGHVAIKKTGATTMICRDCPTQER